LLETPRAETSCEILFVSPDGKTHAVVLPVDVSLYTTSGSGDTLTSKDHSSPRGENGHYVYAASSGGHQPWSFPIMVFSRKRNAFATFSAMIHDEPPVSGDLEFSGPHTLTAKT
jgi:hypothetical protein